MTHQISFSSVRNSMTNNPEKMKVDDNEEENEDSDEQWSDDESDMREIVLGLPALRISSRILGDSNVAEREKEEARLNEQAVVAAQLVMAAAEEAVMKGKSDDGGSGGKKKSRPRKFTKTDDGTDGSGKGEAKKPKKKAAELTHPPKGPPVCHICGKGFGSWKAVFGHMRAHRDRNYQGFLPPPTFSTAAEKFSIPGQNSAFVLVTAGGGSTGGLAGEGGSTGGVSASGGGGAPGSEGGRGSGIDLNVEPVEEVEEATKAAKFDLNKSPPKDDEEEDKAK